MGFTINKSSIVFSFNLCGTRYRIYTGLTTNHWDQKKQRVKKVEDFAWEKNSKLEKYEDLLDNFRNRSKLENWNPDTVFVEAAFKQLSETKKESKPSEVVFIYQVINRFRESKKITLKESHLKNFRSLADYFEKHHRMITFSEVSRQFLEEWVSNLFEVEGLLHNTVCRKVRELRSVGNYARRLGIEVHPEYDQLKFKEIRYQPFYLDWDTQVKTFEQVDLSGRHDRIRDRFLFRCYTGMREGEMDQLIPEAFVRQGEKVYLRYMDLKGKKTKSIQINPKAMAIAEKYGYDLPKCSQQEENSEIKEVAKLAGITGTRQKVRHKGAETVQSMIAVTQMISSHTARRTFARRWYEQGGDLLMLSKYLGHSSIRTTEIYIGVEQDDVNDEMMRVMS